MLYYLVRPLARLALKFWFTKIHLVHLDRVPQSDPVIMAINHPTIFIEPCVMACYQPRALFFLAKGVLFVSPFVSFLKSLHMIPLYRQKDGGFDKRKANVGTFDYCYKIFAKKGAILIMPEGSTKQIRQLRSLTKGFAKMAFGAYEKDNETRLKILPVGINFSNADKFRSEVSVGFGKPLEIQDYVDLYKNNPREATKKLMEDLYGEMLEQVVHVNEKEDFLLADQILHLVENQTVISLHQVVIKNSNKIVINKKLTHVTGKLTDALKADLKSKTAAYFQKLTHAGISDYALVHAEKYKLPTLIFLILTHPLFLVGWLTNALPYGFGLFCGSKTKDVETRMSVVLGMTFGFYLIYYPIMIFLGWYFGVWWLLMAVLIPVFGYFSVIYLDIARRYRGAMKVRQLPSIRIEELHQYRKEILKIVEG